MRQTVIVFAAFAIGAAVLTGCGSTESAPSAYCKEAASTVGKDNPGDTAALTIRAHKLADLAPPEIKADWQAISANADSSKDFAKKLQADPKAAEAEVLQMQQKMGKLQASAKKISEYNNKNCSK